MRMLLVTKAGSPNVLLGGATWPPGTRRFAAAGSAYAWGDLSLTRPRGPETRLHPDSYIVDRALPLPERALLKHIRQRLGKRSRAVISGVGDDCAVLGVPPGHNALVTTDFSLEGIHFRREWHPPESVGHRCLARGLSDIAAMGGDPVAAFLSLAVPARLPQSWVDQFMQGLLKLAARAGVVLAGGDTAESPAGVLADIVVLGWAPRGKAILRSGAHPGDRIYVTGELGGSSATLNLLFKAKKRLAPKDYPPHFFPMPRLEVGRVLSRDRLASSMIDISDGLSTDLMHICKESGVGAEVNKEAIPVARNGSPGRRVGFPFALHGGEDYELLFTAPAHKCIPARIGGIPITEIGGITRGKKIFIRSADGSLAELSSRGWEHFRN